MLSFFPRDVLDEILNLIESVSGGVFLPTFTMKCPSISFCFNYAMISAKTTYVNLRRSVFQFHSVLLLNS